MRKHHGRLVIDLAGYARGIDGRERARKHDRGRRVGADPHRVNHPIVERIPQDLACSLGVKGGQTRQDQKDSS